MTAQRATTSPPVPYLVSGPGSLEARFPRVDGDGDRLDFGLWLALGEPIALEVANAFILIFAHWKYSARVTGRRQLNKLWHFLNARKSEGAGIGSLADLSGSDMLRFKDFIDPVESTRRNDWSVAKKIVTQACAMAGRPAPAMEDHPWSRKAPEWSAPKPVPTPAKVRTPGIASTATDARTRNRLASAPTTRTTTSGGPEVARLDVAPSTLIDATEIWVFFPARDGRPAHRQHFNDWWAESQAMAREVAAAVSSLKRDNAGSSITTWSAQARPLLRFVTTQPSAKGLQALHAMTAAQLHDFKAFIDKGDVATRGKIWRVATSIVSHACKSAGRTSPHFVDNPWPGHAVRAPTKTKSVTIEHLGMILRACLSDMQETLRKAERPDYPGPYLPELFPFIVVLALWTAFNPETVMGVRRSGVRPDMLGRFVIVGHKGRSPSEQSANFSTTDDHPCAPKSVIANVEAITRPLRHRLPPDEGDLLFVGLMREAWRATALVKPFLGCKSMQSHYRDAFCEAHGLEKFSLQQIRATAATVINRLFGGDLKLTQVLMGHMRIETTDDYVREEGRRLEEERLADQMEKRVRFARSRGLTEVRDAADAPQSAATAGFVCASPFESPASLGQEGGMCAAYGACPTCPLASVDRRCPTSFAYVLRLRNQIVNARNDPEVSPQRWISVWKPRLAALDERWLPSFASEVASAAARGVWDVKLAPLPDLGDF